MSSGRRLDVRGVVTRAEARDVFLHTLNRLRPDVMQELRAEGPLTDKETLALAESWARRWNLDAPCFVTWAFLVVANFRTARALRPRLGDTYERWDADRAADPVRFFDLAMECVSGEFLDHSDDAIEAGRVEAMLVGDDAALVEGPNPLRETREQFLGRMAEAWADAVEVVSATGATPAPKRREVEQHCEWLVRHQIQGETAAQILAGRRDGGNVATVSKALRKLADLLELPLRRAQGRRKP